MPSISPKKSLLQRKKEKLLEGRILRQKLLLEVNMVKSQMAVGQLGAKILKKVLQKTQIR